MVITTIEDGHHKSGIRSQQNDGWSQNFCYPIKTKNFEEDQVQNKFLGIEISSNIKVGLST